MDHIDITDIIDTDQGALLVRRRHDAQGRLIDLSLSPAIDRHAVPLDMRVAVRMIDALLGQGVPASALPSIVRAGHQGTGWDRIALVADWTAAREMQAGGMAAYAIDLSQRGGPVQVRGCA